MYEPRYQQRLIQLLETAKGVTTVRRIASVPGKVITTLVYDIDGDGISEILVSLKGGKVLALRQNGETAWSFDAQDSVFGISAKYLARQRECLVALGSDDNSLYLLDGNGAVRWNYKAEGWISGVAVADCEKDEIAVYAGSDDRHVYAFDLTGGLKWKYKTQGKVKKIRVSDVDKDGSKEIVAISYDKSLHILDQRGVLKRKIPTGNEAGRELFIADVNHDGYEEIIIATFNGRVYLYSHRGELKWTYRTRGKARTLCVADVDADTSTEIIVGSEGGFLHVLSPRGDLKWAEQFDSRFFSLDLIAPDGKAQLLLGLGNSLTSMQLANIKWLVPDIRDSFLLFGNLDKVRSFLDTRSYEIVSNIALSNPDAQPSERGYLQAEITRAKALNLKEHHVFVSYVRDDSSIVDRLCSDLLNQGINTWVDRENLYPGQRWKSAIRQAISDGAFFVSCFSKSFTERVKSYMNEEILLAIDELRQRPTDRVWFIPVKLTECEIPDRTIGGGETLKDLQYVELYKDWEIGIGKIVESIKSYG